MKLKACASCIFKKKRREKTIQPENNPKSLSRDEALALLKYMEHHNAHHAEELLEAAAALTKDESELIAQSVSLLEQSSEKLRLILGKTEE